MRNFWRSNWAVVVVLGLALVLRSAYLNGSFWLDEAAQALEADRSWREQLQIVDDFQPPLLHVLTFVAIQFSKQEWWLRWWGALLPGLLTVWGTYELGRKLSSKRVGLLASLLLATSSFHIYFSQELRPYSLSAMLAVWSWFFLLEAEQVGQDSYQLPRGNIWDKILGWLPVKRDFFLFLLMSVLGVYSSYLYPFVLAGQVLWLMIRRRLTQVAYAVLIPSVAFLPWLPTFWRQLQAGQNLRQTFPGWENIVSFSWWRAPTLTVGKFLYGVVDLELDGWYIGWTLLWLVLVAVVVVSHSRRFYKQNRDRWSLLVYMMIVPFVLASVVSWWVPVIQPKRVIYLLPIAYVFVSFLIFGRRRDWRELSWASWGLLAWLLFFNLAGVVNYYTQPASQRENWRHLLATLHQEYDPRETVAVFAYQAPFSPWMWYERDQPVPFVTVSTGSYDTSTMPDLTTVLQPVTNYQRVIVFDYLRSLTDSRNLVPQTLQSWGWVEEKVLVYPNIGMIRIYSPVAALERAADESRH